MMTNEKIAELLNTAAEMLGEEAVRYALGLDRDFLQTHRHETVIDSNGNKVWIEVPMDEAEAEAEMQDDMDRHDLLVEQLLEAARELNK